MTRPTLRERILSALALAPMTDAELARCLTTRKSYVEAVRIMMLKRGMIRLCGYGPRRAKRGMHPHRYAPQVRA